MFVYYTCDQRMWAAEKCGKRNGKQWSAEYLESPENLRIFRGRYIVGTLTNNAHIIYRPSIT